MSEHAGGESRGHPVPGLGLAVGCAAAVVLGGYGALLWFWRSGSHPAGVPGLFSYRSATWGDGFLLPLLAFCLCVLIAGLPRRKWNDSRSRRWLTVLAVVVGAGAGGLVIFTWLADPSPALNWTIPRPHRFNAAGVWHAGFLVTASGLFAGLWVEMVRRLRTAGRRQASACLRSPAAAGAVAGTTGYAWLATADSARVAATAAGRGSLVALGLAGALLMACLAWAARASFRATMSCLLTGVLLAAAVLLFAEVHGQADALVYWALIGSLGAGLALASAPGRQGDVPAQELLAVTALFLDLTLVVATADELELEHVLLVPLLAVVASALLLRPVCGREAWGWRTWPGISIEYLAAAGISASLLAAGVFGLWQSQRADSASITGGFLLTIVGAVLGGAFLPFFKADFEEVMRVEGDRTKRRPDGRPGPEQSEAAARAWPRLAGYAVSAFISMLVLTMALARDLGWQGGSASPPWPPLRLTGPRLGILVILAVLLVPPGVALREACKPHSGSGRERPSGTQVPAWCCLVLGIAACALFLPGVLDQAFQPLAVVQAVLLSAFAVQSILGNGAWLNLGQVRLASRTTVPAVSLAVLTSIYWSLTGGVRPGGSAASPGATVRVWTLTLLVVVLLVELTAAAVYVAGGRPYRTDYAPAKNVLQDLFHLMLLWFVLGWLPQFVLTNIPAAADERWSAIGTILAGFLLLFGPAFLWILENNDSHVERQRRVRGVPATGVLARLRDASSSTARIRTLRSRILYLIRSVRHPDTESDEAAEREFLVRLSGHTAVQNTLALALAGVSVIGTVGVSAGLTPTATGLTALPASRDQVDEAMPDTDRSAAPV